MMGRLAKSKGWRKFRRNRMALVSLALVGVYLLLAAWISVGNIVNEQVVRFEDRPMLGMLLRASTRAEVGPRELPGLGAVQDRVGRLQTIDFFVVRAERALAEASRVGASSDLTVSDVLVEQAIGERRLADRDLDVLTEQVGAVRTRLDLLGESRGRKLAIDEAVFHASRLAERVADFEALRADEQADEDELLVAQEELSLTLEEIADSIERVQDGIGADAPVVGVDPGVLLDLATEIFDAADPDDVRIDDLGAVDEIMQAAIASRPAIDTAVDGELDGLEAMLADLYPEPTGVRELSHRLKLLLGTDKQGRSILVRAVYSGKIAIQVGVVTALIAVSIGTLLGTAAAFFGGWVDHAANWLYSMVISIPYLVLLAVLAFLFLGSALEGTLIPLYTAFGLTYWTGPYRVIRGEALKIKELEYVQAATAIGFGRLYIMLRHIVPNTSHLIFINFSLLFIAAIKGEVILTFLGLGLKEGASWGLMISQSKAQVVGGFFWQLGAATFFMFVLVLAFNILTDALQDAFDPKHVA